jgi:hypothetical protein
MLKILEKCLQSNPELNDKFKIQQIIEQCSLNDLRTISGKMLIN